MGKRVGRRSERSVARAAVVVGALIASGAPAVVQDGDGAGVDRRGWRAVDPGYTLSFPCDHAAHPDHRIEWWYYTGNLRAADGRRFGYQLTFFRVGVDRRPVNPSRWAVRDLYMAHFAVTDVDDGAHHVFERLNRAGVGWAGASAETLHVWNDGWAAVIEDGAGAEAAAVAGRAVDDAAASAEAAAAAGRPVGRDGPAVTSDDGQTRRASCDASSRDADAVTFGGGGHSIQRLTAASDDGAVAIDLRLDPVAPPVLHGANGFSQKGASAGNASHYYSFTRLRTSGRLTVGGETFDVEGLSWMDHEFGTSFLEPAQAGWDWFSIQLDDGTDLMVYVMRRTDGARDPRSSGTLVTPAGPVRLRVDDFRLTPGRRWMSPVSGAAYPVAWRVEVPAQGLVLDVTAAIDAQELRTGRSTGVTYWEGVIDVRGTRAGAPVAGVGYLEMTGYAGAPMSTVLR